MHVGRFAKTINPTHTQASAHIHLTPTNNSPVAKTNYMAHLSTASKLTCSGLRNPLCVRRVFIFKAPGSRLAWGQSASPFGAR